MSVSFPQDDSLLNLTKEFEMKRCFHCERALSRWRFRCQVCKSWNWRLPQITVFALVCLVLIGGSLAAIDYFIYSKQSVPAAQSKQGQDVYHPQYTLPVSQQAPPAKK